MKLKIFVLTLSILTFTACSIPVDAAPPPTALMPDTPQPTLIAPATFTPIPALTQVATSTPTVFAPVADLPFCEDPRGRELLTSFSAAIASKDGALLASLVSPSFGMDVRYYRDGNVVNYDVEHAKFVLKPPSRLTGEFPLEAANLLLAHFRRSFSASLAKGIYTGCDH
ncbi:MAG: hypothetical protein IPN96_15855 [Anaerolineales bacterium]|nr:hypothetical protein [Anaerolineales bacterium]